MLTKNPSQRPSAAEVWADPWVQGREVQDQALVPEHLQLLQHFHTRVKLQHAALTYIASRLLAAQELSSLQDAFYRVDKDGDGRISAQELYQAYEGTSLQLPNVEKLLREVDADQNGYLDYSEFITAATNWGELLTEERLSQAFKAFDTDNNGTISKAELKAMFKGDELIQDEVWQAIMQESDRNRDGVIDFAEFKQMVQRQLS